jgi:hypothetical protein
MKERESLLQQNSHLLSLLVQEAGYRRIYKYNPSFVDQISDDCEFEFIHAKIGKSTQPTYRYNRIKHFLPNIYLNII